MDSRSWSSPGRASVVVCAVFAPAVLPSAALGAGPVPALDQVQRTVGEAVSQAGDLAKPPAPPVAPAPKAKVPAPAPRASSPARATAPPARPAPARQTAQARATASQNSAPAATQDRAAPPAARSSGTQAAPPSDAAATPRPVFATGADIAAADDEAALPFTGSRTLPLLVVAMLALLAGFGLRRVVRTG